MQVDSPLAISNHISPFPAADGTEQVMGDGDPGVDWGRM